MIHTIIEKAIKSHGIYRKDVRIDEVIIPEQKLHTIKIHIKNFYSIATLGDKIKKRIIEKTIYNDCKIITSYGHDRQYHTITITI